uniref:Uncharacterized protein n=1 Tax=Mimiviridae sp. ChoanoV1 TaxID=2596887 RepID=A0A5B8HWA9_9VIRU|nr:hypothetical protein 7_27 [Mimiviridae sp. ChoanoV1]
MKLLFYSFLIIPLISSLIYIFKNENFNSYSIQNKINDSLDNNFTYSLGIIPHFDCKNFDFLEYYDMIDFININHKNDSIYKKPKISIKISHLSDNKKEQWKIFKSLVDYAYHKDIMIWISTVRYIDIKNEYEFFFKTKDLNYTNIGITLSTYNKDIFQKVENVINHNGSIRLVKGYYSGNIKEWGIVTENYKLVAQKLIEDKNYHVLATHDFEILNYLKDKFNKKFDFQELNFFYNSRNFVLKKVKNFTNPKGFYISFGNNYNYITSNIFVLDITNILSRKIKYLQYMF